MEPGSRNQLDVLKRATSNEQRATNSEQRATNSDQGATNVTTSSSVINDNLDYTLFSWSQQKKINPIAIERAEGVYMYDYDGKRYLDFSSGLMNVNIGHGHPRVANAVMKQMQEVSYVTPSCVTKARGDLGKKLAEITPGNLKKTLFTTGGAEAIDNAIKLARLRSEEHTSELQSRVDIS